MLTLEDIKNLPNDPQPEHLIAAGLLPAPAPPAPSAIPPVGPGTIPKPSPVNAPPTLPAWHSALASSVPAPKAPLPPLSPVNTGDTQKEDFEKKFGAGALSVAPDMGTGMPQADPTGINAPIIPQLPHLGFKERQALPLTSEGVAPGSKEEALSKLERLEDQKANPWGSPENHPGLLGKIAHIAAKVGNIAGDIVAPATMANIPGTELSNHLEERGLKREIAQGEGRELEQKKEASEEELRGAETKRNIAEADKAEREVPEKEINPEGQTFDDLEGQTNPKTGEPYTSLERYEAVKQAGAKPKELTPANTPATPEAIADYQEKLKSLGLDSKSGGTFSTVPPGTTMGELEKRYTDAKSLREMGQKDRENAIRDQERRDNAAEHVKEHAETEADKKEKEGRTLVRYRDESGHSVVENIAKAKAHGVTPENMEEVPSGEKTTIQDARAVTQLLNKKGTAPAQMGVKQLIDGLDKDGKLGVVSSRMNSFLSGGVGALPGDDPRIMALLDKSELAMTLSMKSHFGASGGRSPQMLQHFLDMANARKMSGPALRAGFNAVGDYMEDRAELPKSGGGGGNAGVQVHNGFEYTKGDDGQWHKGKAVQP
jgi:hypothetical protein